MLRKIVLAERAEVRVQGVGVQREVLFKAEMNIKP